MPLRVLPDRKDWLDQGVYQSDTEVTLELVDVQPRIVRITLRLKSTCGG